MEDRGEGKPPRRARFQVHLSTAIVLMFVSGALMWANTNPRITLRFYPGMSVCSHYDYGWPFEAFGIDAWPQSYTNNNHSNSYFENEGGYVQLKDISVALIVLSLVWYACEWLIRRRQFKNIKKQSN
jgi:hypothetical protein